MSKRSSRPLTDVYEAFRAVVHDYGVSEMAGKIGIPVGTLYNKANVNESTMHKPNLGEGVLVQVVSGDTRIVETECHILGGLFVKLPPLHAVSDVALVEMICDIHVQDGLFHDELKRALADKKFTKDEYKAINKRAMEYVRAILEAVKRIEGMIDE